MISLSATVHVALFSLRFGQASLFFCKAGYMEVEIYDRASFQNFLNLNTFLTYTQSECFLKNEIGTALNATPLFFCVR